MQGGGEEHSGKETPDTEGLRQEGAWDSLGMEIQVAHMEYDRKQSWLWGQAGSHEG